MLCINLYCGSTCMGSKISRNSSNDRLKDWVRKSLPYAPWLLGMMGATILTLGGLLTRRTRGDKRFGCTLTALVFNPNLLWVVINLLQVLHVFFLILFWYSCFCVCWLFYFLQHTWYKCWTVPQFVVRIHVITHETKFNAMPKSLEPVLPGSNWLQSTHKACPSDDWRCLGLFILGLAATHSLGI